MRSFGENSRRTPAVAEPEPDFDQLMQEKDGAVDRAMRDAVRSALMRHKLLRQSVVVCEDDKVIRVAPDDIPVD